MMVSAPTGSTEVVRVAVVTPFAVLSAPVPSVVPPLAKVTVPIAGADAPATVGTVKVRTTGEPKLDAAGLAVNESAEPEATPTVSVVDDAMALKLPLAGAVAVIESAPTGRAEVVVVAKQAVGVPDAGSGVMLPVPSVTPPLANVIVDVGHAPLMGAMDSVRVTVMPKVSPVAGDAESVPLAVAGVTVSVAVALPAA